ncbi:SRPBCC family protein [Streptomyces yaizuensis]|uniref:SRPBCC family protein n=1 Tax=Streptomyces yaizuensis TaxID=2989713 RepID=A0ABQ5NQQ6_9ACTN|nr:SRPBCC family protein [Streptomyces sp. YSPA8]GLF92650.1 SRPBCC family protein [Streptomyces sp. YSPA8]
MGEASTEKQPIFSADAGIHISAAPFDVYAVISDLPRSGEWSRECRGGAWITGEPAAVGSVFRGDNVRATDVVGWAPVVRGEWTTHAEVVAAEPGRTFRWAMCDSAGRRQQSVWGFDIAPASSGGGSLLIHHFRMDSPTEGIRVIVSEMGPAEKERFFAEWGDKIADDLSATLRRVKDVIESA